MGSGSGTGFNVPTGTNAEPRQQSEDAGFRVMTGRISWRDTWQVRLFGTTFFKDLAVSFGGGGRGGTWLPGPDDKTPPSPISPIASVVAISP